MELVGGRGFFDVKFGGEGSEGEVGVVTGVVILVGGRVGGLVLFEIVEEAEERGET